MTIYDFLLRLLSALGWHPAAPPNLDEHSQVVKNLQRAVQITRVSFPDGTTPPTGNFIEDLATGHYQEPKP